MENRTLGQRIGQERKKLGLSQEALGEKLGVSRQAISKWEADGAVPEIDKLITLSKLFGVSLGWLLGVEEAPAADTFSPAQLKTLEELLRRQTPEKPEKKLPRWIALALAALILVQGGLLFSLNRRVRALKVQVETQVYDNGTSMALRAELQELADRMGDLEARDELPAAPALLSDYTFEILQSDTSPGATVTFSAVANTWREGDRGYLTIYRTGEQTRQIECIREGAFLCASAELDLENGYQLGFTQVEADGTRQQQRLRNDSVENLREHLTIRLSAVPIETGFADGKLILRDWQFTAVMPEAGQVYGQGKWEKIEAVLMQGSRELGSYAILSSEEETDQELLLSTSIVSTIVSIEFSGLELEPGTEVYLLLRARMAGGRENAREIQRWLIDSRGQWNPCY